jgi:hypothetical protein
MRNLCLLIASDADRVRNLDAAIEAANKSIPR